MSDKPSLFLNSHSWITNWRRAASFIIVTEGTFVHCHCCSAQAKILPHFALVAPRDRARHHQQQAEPPPFVASVAPRDGVATNKEEAKRRHRPTVASTSPSGKLPTTAAMPDSVHVLRYVFPCGRCCYRSTPTQFFLCSVRNVGAWAGARVPCSNLESPKNCGFRRFFCSSSPAPKNNKPPPKGGFLCALFIAVGVWLAPALLLYRRALLWQ